MERRTRIRQECFDNNRAPTQAVLLLAEVLNEILIELQERDKGNNLDVKA